MNFNEFTILGYNDYYYVQKKCSVTKLLYRVKLTKEEFHSYYTPKGKNVSHLKMNDYKKDFLLSTLTPEEVKLLTESERKLSKKLWKSRLKLKLKKS